MAGRARGSVTRVSVCQRDAPHMEAASSSAGSMALSGGSASKSAIGVQSRPSTKIMPPSPNSSIGVPCRPNQERSQTLIRPLLGPSSRIQPIPLTMSGAESDRNAPTNTVWRNGTLVRASSQAAGKPSPIANRDEPSAKPSVAPHNCQPLIASTRR